ncbi:small ribosomal subunit protein mS31-like [Penaeus indicus]|uniref:small ribosomal subunit protein mS31-like n=1 Tax=Penaeus indicus TaxID=29960 RepID=UPI00300C3713
MASATGSRGVYRALFNRSVLLSRGQLRPLCGVPPDDGKAPEKQESPETKTEDKKAAAKKKLNDLLASLATTDRIPVERTSSLKLSQPKPRQKTKTPKAKEEAEVPPPEEQVIEPELAAATKEVAKSLGGDVEATESELLSTLRSHALDTSASEKPSANLSELFVGLKVERSQSKPVFERPRRKRYDREDQQRMQQGTQRPDEFVRPTRMMSREYIKTDIFGGEPLNIFSSEEIKAENVESACPVWDATHLREIQQTVVQPPSNAFVEMVQWTRQGKLWTFPIDNEIGLEEEKKIGFQDHVFLEHHLEGWCPRRGPIRHFMELVCTGLSKNPYLTVERKKAHIMWYKNYFEEKHDLLKEIGAIEG